MPNFRTFKDFTAQPIDEGGPRKEPFHPKVKAYADHARSAEGAEEMPDECPVCGGELIPLGSMGKRVHYRCRDCGMDSSSAKVAEGGPDFNDDSHGQVYGQKGDTFLRGKLRVGSMYWVKVKGEEKRCAFVGQSEEDRTFQFRIGGMEGRVSVYLTGAEATKLERVDEAANPVDDGTPKHLAAMEARRRKLAEDYAKDPTPELLRQLNDVERALGHKGLSVTRPLGESVRFCDRGEVNECYPSVGPDGVTRGVPQAVFNGDWGIPDGATAETPVGEAMAVRRSSVANVDAVMDTLDMMGERPDRSTARYLVFGKNGSNKFHVFVKCKSGWFNGYGRMGYDPRTFGPMTQSEVDKKIAAKLAKGYTVSSVRIHEAADANGAAAAPNVVLTALRLQAQAKVLHWQTQSYAEHMAFGGFYDAVDPLVDKLVEALQGKRGKILLGGAASVALADHSAASVSAFLADAESFFAPGAFSDPEIDNIVEEVKAEIDKLKYLLTLK